jgi:hypothetical protein
MREIPLDLDPKTLLTDLNKIALEKGLDLDQVIWTAIDQYILREKGQNN